MWQNISFVGQSQRQTKNNISYTCQSRIMKLKNYFELFIAMALEILLRFPTFIDYVMLLIYPSTPGNVGVSST